jgi:hypothetical protein
VRLTNHDRWFFIQLHRWFIVVITGLESHGASALTWPVSSHQIHSGSDGSH